MTRLFDQEGRTNLEECVRLALEAASSLKAEALVIFTATGEGIWRALAEAADHAPYQQVRIIGVTFPRGADRKGSVPDAEELAEMGIPVIAAALPFSPINTKASQDPYRSLPKDVLGMFGGGMALCVQAIAIACDAGEIRPGGRVVAMSADSAVVALAASTDRVFSEENGLVVEHVVCKPLQYQISRPPQFKDVKQITLPFPAVFPAEVDSALALEAPPLPVDGSTLDWSDPTSLVRAEFRTPTFDWGSSYLKADVLIRTQQRLPLGVKVKSAAVTVRVGAADVGEVEIPTGEELTELLEVGVTHLGSFGVKLDPNVASQAESIMVTGRLQCVFEVPELDKPIAADLRMDPQFVGEQQVKLRPAHSR